MAQGGAIFKHIALQSQRLSQLEQVFAMNVDGEIVLNDPREELKSGSSNVKSDMGFFLFEIGADEGNSMTENLFSNEEFKKILYGENYGQLFQSFNADIRVPKPAHDGLMAHMYSAAGDEFMGALLSEGALGCPNPAGESDPYGGLRRGNILFHQFFHTNF